MGKMFVVSADAMPWKWMKRIKERLLREDMFIIHLGNRITRDIMLGEFMTVTWERGESEMMIHGMMWILILYHRTGGKV